MGRAVKRLNVFIVCSGLGRVNRGYESFFRGCFDALCGEPALRLTLFKGSGERRASDIPLWNTPRWSRAAGRLGKLANRSGYFAEQLTFFMSLLPHLLSRGRTSCISPTWFWPTSSAS